MKFLPLILLLIAAPPAFAQEKHSPITLAELDERQIVGGLGITLGTVCEIEVTIIDGDALRVKELSGSFLMKVQSVNGVPLQKPWTTGFGHFSADQEETLPTGNFGLYKKEHGKPAKVLDSAEIELLKKGYVGSRHRLVVYESGGYEGLPANMPRDVVRVAHFGFGFRTDVTILKRLPNARGKAAKSREIQE